MFFETHPAAHDPLAWPPLSWHSVLEKQVPFRLFGELRKFKKVKMKSARFHGNNCFCFLLSPRDCLRGLAGVVLELDDVEQGENCIFLKKSVFSTNCLSK